MRLVRCRPVVGGALAALVLGCAGGGRYVHPEADLGFYEKVGVIPFATLADDRLAGEKFASSFSTFLLYAHRFELAEPGQFLGAYQTKMGSEAGAPIGLPLDKLQALAEATGVQGVFEGTIKEYQDGGSTARPLISVEVRLVDVTTGAIVWSASETRRGGPAIPILNLGGARTLAQLTERVASDLVGKLPD